MKSVINLLRLSMLTKELKDKLDKYVDGRMRTSSEYYQKKHNAKYYKIMQDIRDGKIGEIFCQQFFEQLGYEFEQEIDFEVHEAKDKSYASDMILKSKKGKHKNIHIHIKTISQYSYKRFKKAFLVQKDEPVVLNPQENHYYAVMLEVGNEEYKLFYMVQSVNVRYFEIEKLDYRETKWKVLPIESKCINF